MDVVSPTRVAAPCKLEETATVKTVLIGETLNLFAISRAIGATIKTVATLSIKAETSPENNASATNISFTSLSLFTSISATLAGIFDSIHR